MKVAIVTESFYPCGVLVVVEDLYNYLINDPEFEPIYVGPATPFNKKHKGVWLPSRIASKTRSYYRTLLFSPSTGRIMKEALEDVDLVHIHSISILTLRTMLLMRKINSKKDKKIKIIFHMHTQADEYLKAWYGIFSPIFIFVLNLITSFCIRSADQVIFPTEFFMKIVTKKFSIPKSKYVVWPAPVEIHTDGVSRRGDLPKPYLAYVGRIVEEKNIKRLVDFFAKFKESIKDLSLVLVGDGDISEHKEYAQRYPNAVDNILFVGQKSHEEVIRINENALAGISFSKTEVQGLAVLEQMATGVPAIVFRNTCWEEIVEESGGGFLLNESDSFPKQASALSGLTSLSGEKGKNAKKYIDKELNKKSRFKIITQIYQQV